MSRALHARRGAAAIETALILPVLLALFGGTVDTAWFLYQRNALVDAAQAAARAGAVTGSQVEFATDASAAAASRLSAEGIDPSAVTVTAEQSTGSTTMITVTLTMPFAPVVGLVPLPESLSASASAHYENTSAS